MRRVLSQELLLAIRLLVIVIMGAGVARGILRSGSSRWKTSSFLLFGLGALGLAVVRGVDFQFEPHDVLMLIIDYKTWSFGIPGLEFPLVLGYGLILGTVLAFPFQTSGQSADLKQELRHSFASPAAARAFLRWLTWVALTLLAFFVFVWLPYQLLS